MEDAKYKYRVCLKKEKKDSLNKITDTQCSNLTSKNNKQFWKSFKSKLGKNTTRNFNIGNSSDPSVIANQFAAQFFNACSLLHAQFCLSVKFFFLLFFASTNKIGKGKLTSVRFPA